MALPQSMRKRFDPSRPIWPPPHVDPYCHGARGRAVLVSPLAGAERGPVTKADSGAAEGLYRLAAERPWLADLLKAVSWLGKPLWLGIAIALGAAYAYWRGHQRLALYLVVTAIGGGLLDSAVKILVDRPRPDIEVPLVHAFGRSFPSGHAMSSTVTYGALLLVFLPVLSPRRRIIAFVATGILLLLIGFSRLLLGVHFISDVLGGYVLGLAWLAGSTAAFSIWRKEEGKKPVHPTEGLEPEAAEDLTPQHQH